MWRHYIYIHFRKSDGIPFYVGKGTAQTKDFYKRSTEPHKNKHWQNTVDKHGIVISIFASCQTDLEAQEQEKLLILETGRLDLNSGTLVNKTEGGDGICGLVISDELRAKRSKAASKPRSQAFIDAIRKARKAGGNGGVVKRGDKLSEEWIRNLALAKVGNKNPMFGKTTKIARQVVDTLNGKIYPSVGKAAEDFKLNMKTLYNMLSGHRRNYTSLEFLK